MLMWTTWTPERERTFTLPERITVTATATRIGGISPDWLGPPELVPLRRRTVPLPSVLLAMVRR